MSGKFKVGDLILLNDFGRLVMDDSRIRPGLIVEGPYNMIYAFTFQVFEDEEQNYDFWSYDILIGGELIKTIPEDFIESVIKNGEEHEE